MVAKRFFQLGLVLFAIVLVVVRTAYRLRAGGTAPGVTNRDEHAVLGNLLAKGVLPLATLLVIAWLVDPIAMVALSVPLPELVRWAGFDLACVGLALLIWVHQTLDRSFSPVLEIHADHRLITHGPYRWIAHPMYTAFLIIDTGLTLLGAYVPLGVLLFGLLIPVIVRRTPKEEAMLLAHFGERYRMYRAGVGTVWPRFKSRS